MRRIDVIGVGLGIFAAGGIAYWLLQNTGLDSATAGIWTQAILVSGLIGWLLTYLLRALSHKMTYAQQLQNYQDAVLQKRLEALTPDELARIKAEIASEKHDRNQGSNVGTQADESH